MTASSGVLEAVSENVCIMLDAAIARTKAHRRTTAKAQNSWVSSGVSRS